jgi:hypothetical protein
LLDARLRGHDVSLRAGLRRLKQDKPVIMSAKCVLGGFTGARKISTMAHWTYPDPIEGK